jgi:protocatechuate 4,5-dioxygenase, alpha chain
MTRADSISSRAQEIFGTPVFDGAAAVRGYALNAMCFSFNKKENREAFQRDEEAYMRQFRLSPEQADAVRARNVAAMIDAGGNIYYLAKLAGILGLGVQDIGAALTGVSVDAFKQKLLNAGKDN